MTSLDDQFGAIIVGGGPAGVAVLLSAHRDGKLRELLQHGLLLVERGARIGKGQIGNYTINSDSTGYTFVDPLRVGSEESLHRILETPVAKRIAEAGAGAVPLQDVGELMAMVGEAMHALIEEYPQSAVLTSCTAESAQMCPDGSWRVLVSSASGRKRTFQTKQLVLATGATQPHARLDSEAVAGAPVVERWGKKLMQSGEVISLGGLSIVTKILSAKAEPKVAILGGSTSAMAVAHALLNRLPEVHFKSGGVTVFHRRPLSVYYTSVEEAEADGYDEFGTDDICPVTQRVFRLAGLRLDSRELLMQVRGIGGRAPEPRMTMHLTKTHDPEALALIDEADLVIAALGYRPSALPILDHESAPVALFAESHASAPLVDAQCRVLDATSNPIAGLYGIGLAAGFIPSGKFGGEPSFVGQANGLWLWQNGIGSIIVNAILPAMASEEKPRPVVVARGERIVGAVAGVAL